LSYDINTVSGENFNVNLLMDTPNVIDGPNVEKYITVGVWVTNY